MNFFQGVVSNEAIVVPVTAWFAAQLLKVIGVLIKYRKIDFTRFVGSGGMPSSHSSFIVSLAVVIGKQFGWQSGEFGICLAVALIVMYDAAGIRRAAGKQAKVLNKIIHTEKHHHNVDEELKELLGHTPFEVIMGATLGVLIGLFL